MIKIDKNVAIPEWPFNRNLKYPWADMEVGDSFIAETPNLTSMQPHCSRVSVSLGKKFVCLLPLLYDLRQVLFGV